MWQKIKDLILKLFDITLKNDTASEDEAFDDVSEYLSVIDVNFRYIIANAIATYTVSDCKLTVQGKGGGTSKRVDKLTEILDREMTNKKVNCTAGIGTGFIATIPYSVMINGERKYFSDTLMKDRFFIKEKHGDVIVSGVALSDIIKDDTSTYMRLTDYSIVDGNFIIKNSAVKDDVPIDLHAVPAWEGIDYEIIIPGVSQLPIAFFINPTGKRKADDFAKPITHGCDKTIKRIVETLEQIDREFKKKEARIFADQSLISKTVQKGDDPDKPTLKQGLDVDLFAMFNNSDRIDHGNGLDIFDPAIRESSYFVKLVNLFSLLEKEIGCSKGILTDMLTGQATATEVRRASLATFSICDQINDSYEAYLNQLAYAYNILLNYYNDTPISYYELLYDRTYSLLEDSAETFRQLSEAVSAGHVAPYRLNMFVTGQSKKEAQAEIAEIDANKPKLTELVGGINEGNGVV